MDEAAVKAWLGETFDVSRETFERLDAFVAMLIAESARQNLIARSTLSTIWDRHIRDSAQLLSLCEPEDRKGPWLDLGSGPGLPGIVLALLEPMRITLVEERARRVAFLEEARAALGLENRVDIAGKKLQKLETRPFRVITARAFAPLPRLFALAHSFSRPDTLWILPKGKSVNSELEAARDAWHYESELVQSETDPRSSILLARNVRPGRKQ